jgi:DnaD/phage-associated family protein
MNIGLLEYLAEYCAQNGHTSVRYLETVALNWHEKGIRTAEEAQEYSTAYTKDAFAVMKAFGLNSRKPAVPEQKIMEKWFKDYGFDRELVLEACSRTINAIHTPSFQYADSILTDWKKAGVKTLADVKGMDARRAERAQNGAVKRLQSYGNGAAAQNNRKTSQNQFHNFKQRDTDYDALMLQNVKEWMDSPE